MFVGLFMNSTKQAAAAVLDRLRAPSSIKKYVDRFILVRDTVDGGLTHDSLFELLRNFNVVREDSSSALESIVTLISVTIDLSMVTDQESDRRDMNTILEAARLWKGTTKIDCLNMDTSNMTGAEIGAAIHNLRHDLIDRALRDR